MDEINKNLEYNRYNNSKIYKLINTVDDTFYIGSTTSTLSNRLYWHRSNSKRDIDKNRKIYVHFRNIGFENVRIVLIEEFNLKNKDQLRREEENYIEKYKHDPNCLNSKRAFLTDQEKHEYSIMKCRNYKSIHKDKISEYNKEYHKLNAEKINERKMTKLKCECGCEITKCSYAEHLRSKKHLNLIDVINSVKM